MLQVMSQGPVQVGASDTKSRLLQEVSILGNDAGPSVHGVRTRCGSSRSRIHEPQIKAVYPPPLHRHTVERQGLKQPKHMLSLRKGERHMATPAHWDSEILLRRLKGNPLPRKANVP